MDYKKNYSIYNQKERLMSFILNYSDFLNEVVQIPVRKKTDKPTEEKKPDQEVQENPNTSSDTQQPNKFFIG